MFSQEVRYTLLSALKINIFCVSKNIQNLGALLLHNGIVI